MKTKKFVSIVLAVAMMFTLLTVTPIGAYAAATIQNKGYIYGKQIGNDNAITLVCDAVGSDLVYRWQCADQETGPYTDMQETDIKSGEVDSSEITLLPQKMKWYRCVVNGTASQPVMTLQAGDDNRTWTYPRAGWYISNGVMAYQFREPQNSGAAPDFDVVGLYSKNGTDYMLQTTYNANGWRLYSDSEAEPAKGEQKAADLDGLRIAFDDKDPYVVLFEADLKAGQKAFAIGTDTQLGNSATSGNYADYAALIAILDGEKLNQISMIGARSLEEAADEDPAFVIRPADAQDPLFWIGHYSLRQTYARNIMNSSSQYYITTLIEGQNVVTECLGTDSGMTMSWLNVPDGGTVKFQFGVGDAASTGAVPKVDPNATSTTITIPDVTRDIYYSLYDRDGNLIFGWSNTPTDGTDIIYKNLTPDTKYIVKTLKAEDYTGGEPTEENKVGTTEVYTAIEIPEEAVTEVSSHTITISGLEEHIGKYYYYAVDEDGNESEAVEVDEDGKAKIEGLSANKSYTIKARSDENTNSTTLTAQTLIEVTFNMNGHGTQVSPISDLPLDEESHISKPLMDEEADGFYFDAWYKDAGLTQKFDFDNDGITANTVLYAKWKPHEHNWKYRASGSVLEAFCTETVAKCDYYGTSFDDAEKFVTLTITAQDTEYTGKAVQAKYDTDSNECAGFNNLTITYEAKADSSLTEDGKAVELGSYVAKVTLTPADEAPLTAQVDFSIIKPAAEITAKLNSTKNGVVVCAGEVVLTEGKHYTVEKTAQEALTIFTVTMEEPFSGSFVVYSVDDSYAIDSEVKLTDADGTVKAVKAENLLEAVAGELNEVSKDSIVTLTVTPEDTTPEEQQTAEDEYRKKYRATEVNVQSLEITVTLDDGDTCDTITSTTSPVEIALETELAGKTPMFLREHDGDITVFEKLTDKPDMDAYTDGTYYVDEANQMVYLYAQKFSNYYIVYSDDATPRGGMDGLKLVGTALVAGAAATVTYYYMPVWQFRGRVVDAEGNGIAGACVFINQATEDSQKNLRSLHTDEDGYFESRGLRYGEYIIIARAKVDGKPLSNTVQYQTRILRPVGDIVLK